eukprot:jgi/Galph1/893/GphlegSOOS_G5656.1
MQLIGSNTTQVAMMAFVNPVTFFHSFMAPKYLNRKATILRRPLPTVPHKYSFRIPCHCSSEQVQNTSQLSFSLQLQDDTQLTVLFTYPELCRLAEKINQLVLSFKKIAADRQKRIEPAFEYYFEYCGLFIRMECNPNLFSSAFQAKVYLHVYDEKMSIRSQTNLTSLIDHIKKLKGQVEKRVADEPC